MTYRIRGLDPAPYRPLFGLPDEDLARLGMKRMIVSASPGFPCRISLADRAFGEQVILLNHVSHEVANPYRSSHAIFVADAGRAEFVDSVPPALATRMLSLRGFDSDGMMADALIAQPGQADEAIRMLFDNPQVEAIHAHNAVRGCFAARIGRD